MDDDVPKFSVIIPTFNRAQYLDEAIASVLRQTCRDFELIVSDNCSTDNTCEVMKKYARDSRLRYFCNEENIGMVPNWRRAVFERSSGDWFIIMSDDDYFVDDDYLTDVARVTTDNDVSLVYGGGYVLNTGYNRKVPLVLPFSGKTEGAKVFASRGTVFPQDFTLCNVIFRRDVAVRFNAFSDACNYSCDTELFLNSCIVGDVFAINRAVSIYRVHESNLINMVSKDPSLLVGNLQAFLLPYINAKEALAESDIKSFMRNCRLVKMVRQTYLSVLAKDKNMADKTLSWILEVSPEMAAPLRYDLFFKIKCWFVGRFGRLYTHWRLLREPIRRLKHGLEVYLHS